MNTTSYEIQKWLNGGKSPPATRWIIFLFPFNVRTWGCCRLLSDYDVINRMTFRTSVGRRCDKLSLSLVFWRLSIKVQNIHYSHLIDCIFTWADCYSFQKLFRAWSIWTLPVNMVNTTPFEGTINTEWKFTTLSLLFQQSIISPPSGSQFCNFISFKMHQKHNSLNDIVCVAS